MDRRDSEHPGRPGVRSFADWMFRSRETSRIVVAQVPNALLLVWLAATVVRWAVQPDGAWRTTVDLVAGLALVAWALDEIVRGVNPFRRLLGVAVLAGVIINLRNP